MQYQLTQKGKTSLEVGSRFNINDLNYIEQICREWLQQHKMEDTEDNWGCLRMFVKSGMVICINGKLSDVSPKGWELINGEYRQRHTVEQINKLVD